MCCSTLLVLVSLESLMSCSSPLIPDNLASVPKEVVDPGFLLHEKVTLHDLKMKVNISSGVQGHLQRLTYDAHGLNPILATDSAPLSSVGLGHGAVV